MEKLYYSISEVSERLGVKATTLRFWEREFRQLKPKVSAGGTRRYSAGDIEVIETIIRLTRDNHLSLEGARQRMERSFDADMRKTKAINGLKSVRAELKAIFREMNGHEALKEDTIID